MDFHLDRDGFPGSPGKTAWPGFNWARYYPQFQALGGICELFVEGIRKHQRARHTVDGRNPAPVEVGSLSHSLQGFYTFQVVQDFSHQQ